VTEDNCELTQAALKIGPFHASCHGGGPGSLPHWRYGRADVRALHLLTLLKQLKTQARAFSLGKAHQDFQQIAGEYRRIRQALRGELEVPFSC